MLFLKKLIIMLATQWTKLLFWFFWLMVPNLITNNVFGVFLLVWNWKTLEKEVTSERSNCNVFHPIVEIKKCHMQHNIDICVIIVTKGKCKYFWIRDVNGEACAPSNDKMLGNDIQEGIGFINWKFPLLYKKISFANQLSKVKISSIFNLTWIFQKSPLHYRRRLISKVFGAQATTNYALMGPWALANYMFKLVWFNFNITNICYISFICWLK